MTQDNVTNVINFEKKGRRKAIARLTKNYAPILAHVMQASMLDDGEHVDENDLPMCRALDRSEMRHGAVANAALLFARLMHNRAILETNDRKDGLGAFSLAATRRATGYHADNLGKSRIVVSGKYKRDLLKIEQNYASAIFTALRLEAKNDPNFSEAEFWPDIFRGFGDADPSGIVLRAAGLVLLDHLTHFHLALTADSKETA